MEAVLLAGFYRLGCNLVKNLAMEISRSLIFLRHDYSGLLARREKKTKNKVKTMELTKPVKIRLTVAQHLKLLKGHGPIRQITDNTIQSTIDVSPRQTMRFLNLLYSRISSTNSFTASLV
jgi:hypothetical protein